jgi:hypothetical protein
MKSGNIEKGKETSNEAVYQKTLNVSAFHA